MLWCIHRRQSKYYSEQLLTTYLDILERGSLGMNTSAEQFE